jgi:hypothetical protein
MRAQVTPPELVALRRHWRRWAALVALHARRSGRAADPREYEALHRELLAASRALAAAEGARREFYRRLEEVARPWLTARALEQADRELLLDLLARCRQAERELRPPPWPGAGVLWAAAAVALSGAVAAVVLLFWTAGRAWSPAQEWLRGRWQAVGQAARATGEAGWWFVAGAVVALVAIVVVWRGGRITGR